jgi:hypothetical protein
VLGFTPVLASWYAKCAEEGDDALEVVFCSSDRSPVRATIIMFFIRRDSNIVYMWSLCLNGQQEFQEYYGSMPWVALPHGSAKKGELSQRFQVSGIPM